MFDTAKERILIYLESKGWQRNPKEKLSFSGISVEVSRGSFFRQHEKDDAWLFLLARHCKFIIDVGCNVGQSSLLLLIGTKNEMICIDPNPRALSMCAENLIFNRLSSNVRFINAFVGEEEDKEISFFTVGAGAAGSMFSGFAKTAAQLGQSKIVSTRTLGSICKQCNFKPEMVKIDVEGAEQLVLRGMDEWVLSSKPKIFVEVHSGKELSIIQNTNAILNWCREKGYQAYYLKEHSLITDAVRISNRGRYHLLLLANGEEYPPYLFGVPENAPLTSVLDN